MKMSRKISISVFIFTLLAVMLITFLSAFTVVSKLYDGELRKAYLEASSGGPGQQSGTNTESYPELKLIDTIFKAYSIFELDDEAIMDAVLKAYTDATGDRYAEYYNAEEFAAMTSDNAGEMQGIGINVIENTEYGCIEVINVLPESPALAAGLLPGDLIVYVGKGEEREAVSELGYSVALKKLQGLAGTVAEFAVRRRGIDGEELEFSIERGYVKTVSVMFHICETDPTVGIVKIVEFDLTTPRQFSEAVDSLRACCINKFIFDVRYNPGGDLQSIVAVLSYFLDENDVILSTKDNLDNREEVRVKVSSLSGDYAGCSVRKEDIGKYKGLKSVVLVNGSTASAAELFTSNFRDYHLATIIGTTTYGKGSMQSILSLVNYGYKGGVKLTTKLYYPPCGESYDGIGISPDIELELDETLKNKNIYKITDAEDNQIRRALEALK